jgi:elongation factor P
MRKIFPSLSSFSRFFCTYRARELIKPGIIIRVNNEPHKVIKITLGKRGKGGGFVKARLKHILTLNTFEKTFQSDELIEEANVIKIKSSFSWLDQEDLIFMNLETFEEIRILKEYVPNAGLLAEGEEYKIIQCEGKYVGVDFPNLCVCTVVETTINAKG